MWLVVRMLAVFYSPAFQFVWGGACPRQSASEAPGGGDGALLNRKWNNFVFILFIPRLPRRCLSI